ncbi:hypothetical protein ACUHMQ_13475 [Chitinimonas sp. PSY-7]|uniref:hypothetical protein n=1 Tax=Chitinimonas sp. PSY-7 TaxID=3459088 RepID=UPI00403FD2F2
MSDITIGTLTIDLAANVARLSTDMDQAKRMVASTGRSISDSLDRTTKELQGMADMVTGYFAALGVNALAGVIKGSIDAADAIGDLSERTGVAASTLSAWQYAAQLSDTSIEALGTSMGKLSKEMANGNDAFAAMGISIKGAGGHLKDTDAVLLEVADKFAGYEDGAAKAALAQELFGKSGTEMLPFLNQGSAGLAELRAEAESLGAVLDDSTVQAAGQFNDQLDKLHMAGGGFATQIAAEMLPALTAVTGSFLSSAAQGGSLRIAVDGLGFGLKGLISIGYGVVSVFDQIGTLFGGLAAAAVAAANRDWTQAKSIAVSTFDDMARKNDQYADRISAVWAEVPRQVADAAGAASDIGVKKATAPIVKGFGEAGKKAAQEMAKAVQAEWQALSKWFDDGITARQKALKQLEDQVTDLDREYQNYGRSKSQIAAQQLRLIDEEIAAERELAEAIGVKGTVELDYLERKRTAQQRVMELTQGIENKDRAREAAEAATKEWQKAADSIDGIFRDTFANLFNGNHDWMKTFGKALRTTVATALADAVYSATVKGAVNDLMGMMRQAMQGGSQGGVSGGGGFSLGNLGNWAEAGKSLWQSFSSNGFGAVSTAMASGAMSMANFFSSPMMAEFALGMSAPGAGTMMGGGAATGAFSAGQGVATAAPWLAGAAVGHYGGRAISGGYSVFGGSGNAAVNVGTTIGAIWGPIGMAIGGAIGGAVNRAFGRKPREVTASGIQGSISDQGFDGHHYESWQRKGGLFRSTKRGTDYRAIDSELDQMLDSGVSAVRESVRGYAQAIGLSANAVDGYTKAINVALSGDAAKDKELFGKLFGDIGDEMAQRVAPGIDGLIRKGETAHSTLMRLAGTFTTTNQIMEAMGKNASVAFGGVGLASAEARQHLVDLAGGIQGLSAKFTSYYSQYYTEVEQQARATEMLRKQFAELGYHLPSTREAFRRLVEGQDLTSEVGRKQYNTLLDLAGAFAALNKETVPAIDRVNDIKEVFATTNRMLDMMSKDRVASFGISARADYGEKSRRDLIELGGGMQALTSKFDSYYNAFYSEAEKQAKTTEMLTLAFRDLGYSLPTTREEFAMLVEMQDLSTASGRKQFLSLLDLASGLASITDDIDAATKSAARTAEEAARAAAQTTEAWKAAGGNLRKYLDGMVTGNANPLGVGARYGEAEQQYNRYLGQVRGGDVGMMDELQSAAQQLLALGRERDASSMAYASLYQKILGELNAVAESAQSGKASQGEANKAAVQTVEVLRRSNELLQEQVRNSNAVLRQQAAIAEDNARLIQALRQEIANLSREQRRNYEECSLPQR